LKEGNEEEGDEKEESGAITVKKEDEPKPAKKKKPMYLRDYIREQLLKAQGRFCLCILI